MRAAMGGLFRGLTKAGLFQLGRSAAQFAGKSLEEAAAEGLNGVFSQLAGHFQTRHDQTAQAIQSAYRQSWTLLENWLDPDRIASRLANQDAQQFRRRLDEAFAGCGLTLHGSELAFRQACLTELRSARQDGALDWDDDSPHSAQALAQELSVWGTFDDPAKLLASHRQVREWIPLAFADRCPNLARLLSASPNDEPPFLIAAFDYFLLDALSQDDALFRKLSWARGQAHQSTIETLLDGQASVLTSINDKIDSLLKAVGGLESRLPTARDSLASQDEFESAAVRGFREFLRGLDDVERKRQAPLLFKMLKAGIVTGAFAEVVSDAPQLAQLADDRPTQGKTHYHAYRAALELRDWSEALRQIQRAAELDPDLEPIPLTLYEPERILGMGGFGVAFLCRERHGGDRIVLKALAREEFGSGLDAAFQEIHLVRKLHHESLIRVYHGEFVDRAQRRGPYVAMDYFDGLTLEEWVQRHGPLSVDDYLDVAERIASGLAYVHRQGVWHRDVKPANILVRKVDGEGWQAKIIDFGLAQKVDPAIAAQTRQPSIRVAKIIGTLDYMSPEQKTGHSPDGRSDIYSFGRASLYALTKSRDPSRRVRKAWPEALDELLDRCCEDDRQQRPENFDEIHHILCDLRRPAVFPPPPERKPKPEPEPAPPRINETTTSPLAPRDEVFSASSTQEKPIPSRSERGQSSTDRKPQETKPQPPKNQAPATAFNPKPQPQPQRINADILVIKLVNIPAGEFDMGSTKEEIDAVMARWPETNRFKFDAEQPKHRVHIAKPFLLAAHQVTVGQFRRFWKDAHYQTEAEQDGKGGYGWDEEKGEFRQDARFTWRNPGFEQTDDHPVVNVSWNDANAFCAWLTKKEGRKFTLPTEAQWEYACRAGTTSLYGQAGDDPESQARIGNTADGTFKKRYPNWATIANEDGFVFTAPVGKFQPNAWGLYDMIGNVWEWCVDSFDAKTYEERADAARGKLFTRSKKIEDPIVLSESAASLVVRGGSWSSNGAYCRPAFRIRYTHSDRGNNLGFRVALVP